MIPTVQIKGLFFDRQKVRDMMDKKTHRALQHGLASIRTIARRSMRPGGKAYKVAQSGEAPRAHTRLLKDQFYFYYNSSERSGVVGPVLLAQSRRVGYRVPEALEKGLRVTRRRASVRRIRDKRGRFRGVVFDQKSVGKSIQFKKHPYIGPALEMVSRKLPGYWLGPGT